MVYSRIEIITEKAKEIDPSGSNGKETFKTEADRKETINMYNKALAYYKNLLN